MRKTTHYPFIILIASIIFASCKETTKKATLASIPQPTIAKNGMVITAHPNASKIGLDILKKGGNAFDAMVATQFALAVTYPSAGNIGGGGFMVYRLVDGKVGTLDYREKAPSKAHRDMYLDKDGNPLKFQGLSEKVTMGRDNIRDNASDANSNLSVIGRLAIGVPGTVAGMVAAHRKFGKLPFMTLIQPSIDLARAGVVLTEKEAEKLNSKQATIRKANRFKSAYEADDKWNTGDTLFMPDLANTLALIRDHGRDGFYKGTTADLIVDEMKAGKGIITHKDLVNYEAKWREPIEFAYRDCHIITMGPPSSGGIVLGQMLKMIAPYDLNKLGGFQSVRVAQLMIEAERRAYADRAAFLGDPDFVAIPTKALLSDKYTEHRMRDFSFEKASKSEDISNGNPLIVSEQTTHYTIVDRWGNAIANTTTLNGYFGSKVVVKGGGFFLNNEMDDFSIKAGYPNMYGLIGKKANAIAPHKRMLSSMTPTIITKRGKLFATIGTPGGATIITSVFQTILNIVDFKMNAQQAVSSSRFHHQWQPDKVFIEKATFDTITKKTLKEKGYPVFVRGALGRVEAIIVRDDHIEGGADHRGDDTALGY